ncbi:MAG: hypothetical protein AAF497_25915, partial [Planctomycetota bacterium]
ENDNDFQAQLRSLDCREIHIKYQSGIDFGSIDAQVIDARTLWAGLDDAQRDFENELFMERFTAGTTILATTGIAASYILWMMRGSYLIALVASSLPTWSMVDPLPILESAADKNKPNAADSLLALVTNRAAV